MTAHHRRRTLVAVCLSLALHACVVWLLVRAPASVVPARRAPLVLTELNWVDVEVPQAAVPGPATQVTVPKAGTGKKRVVRHAPAPVSDLPLAEPGADVLAGPVNIDTPHVVNEISRGRTVRPEDLPGEDELRADEEHRVTARVEGFLKRDLAYARARGGLPDPEYGALGAALRDATKDVPQFVDVNSPKAIGSSFMQSYLSAAENYGRTGAPYAEPEGRLERMELPSEIDRAAAGGSAEAIRMKEFFGAGARLQEFADGRGGVEIYTLLELRQTQAGDVESVELLRPSGLTPFDTWVMEQANGARVVLTWDAGARAKPLRSVWRFDAILTFRRKVKASQLDARAVLSMLGSLGLGALSGIGGGARMPVAAGRFDEMTGEVDLVDLTNPTYDCKVTLLEAD